MAARRPDFKVMVNEILVKIGAMKDNFVSVLPDSTGNGPNPANINGVRYSLQRLKEGHPMGFFPAGAISFYNKDDKEIHDLPWTHSVIRLIRKANVPVYPVYFDFLNSRFFYWLGSISWKIRTLRIPAEAFNKRGKTVDVYVGKPISPEEMKNFLKVVVDNGKVDIVMEIFGAYEELEKKRAKIATAKLRYVTLPSEEQKKKMETFICKTFAADGVSWEMKEDPELLGGFILLVDGKEYDYSMAGRLNRLEQTLMRR